MINALLVLGLALGTLVLSAATKKPLPVGSCVANKMLCNANDPNLDPWQIQCYGGAILKIEAVGKYSYKTGCIEETVRCQSFVTFEDVKAYYFQIECPVEKKEMRLHNSIPLPKE